MKKNILIVDDDKLSRETLARSLVADYHCRTASGVGEALEVIAAGDIDIVLADLVMPEVDGLKILERTVAMDEPPVMIMITGHVRWKRRCRL